MAAIYKVRIDIARFRENLAAAGDPVTDAQARAALREYGFRPVAGDWWQCEEISLRSLDRSEIVVKRRA